MNEPVFQEAKRLNIINDDGTLSRSMWIRWRRSVSS